MSDPKALAAQIMEKLGGIGNVAGFENCMTRLRVTVKDASQVDRAGLKAVPGVLNVVGPDAEPQVVVGPGMADSLSAEIRALDQAQEKKPDDHALMKKKASRGIFQFFSQVFVPLIPVFAGAGLIYGLVKILTLIYTLTGAAVFDPAASQFMMVLNVLASTFFTYLNIAVAMSAARTMGGNPYLGLVAGGIIINLGTLAGTPMGIFNLNFTNGRGGTLAALAAGALIAWLEVRIRRRTPDALKVHIPSLLAIIVTGLVTIYVLQPLGGLITDGITGVLLYIMNSWGFLAYGILAAVFLPLVMVGMHQGLTPIHTTLIQTLGYTPLYSCLSMAGGGQVGAALGLLFKYRDRKALQKAVLAGLPAGLLGIGEPLIFGVTLPLGRVFFLAAAGAFCGGAVLGLFPGQGAVTMSVSGVLGTLVNTRPLAYLLAYAVSVAGGFLATVLIGVRKDVLDDYEKANAEQHKPHASME